jgi:hypothetical protein
MQIVTDVADAYGNTRKYITLCSVQKRKTLKNYLIQLINNALKTKVLGIKLIFLETFGKQTAGKPKNVSTKNIEVDYKETN